MVKCVLGFIFLVLMMINNLEAKKSNIDEKGKIYNFAICAIVSENPEFLREWIEYHRLIGVDHFYLYNVTGKNLKAKFNSYSSKGIITIVDWYGVEEAFEDYVWALSSQVSAYENAILTSAKETRWLVFLEIDEFLVPSLNNSILETLENYHEKPGLTISSTCYDHPESVGKKGLIIQNFKIARTPIPRPQKEVSKTIFKPDQCKGFTWPPYECKFKSGQKPIRLSKSELKINKYVNRRSDSLFATPIKGKIELDHTLIPEDITNELLDDGYEIEDQERVIEKYVPKLLQKMGMSYQ